MASVQEAKVSTTQSLQSGLRPRIPDDLCLDRILSSSTPKAGMAACSGVPGIRRSAMPRRTSAASRSPAPSSRTPIALTPSVARRAPICGRGGTPTSARVGTTTKGLSRGCGRCSANSPKPMSLGISGSWIICRGVTLNRRGSGRGWVLAESTNPSSTRTNRSVLAWSRVMKYAVISAIGITLTGQ